MTEYHDFDFTAQPEIQALSKKTIGALLSEYPFIEEFFTENRLTELTDLKIGSVLFPTIYGNCLKASAKKERSIKLLSAAHFLSTSFR